MVTMNNITTTTPALHPTHGLSDTDVRRLIDRRSFATIATVSPAGFPHAANVLYELIDNDLYVNTLRSSRKAKNVAASGRVGVTIPVRRVPVGGPPSAIQFQAEATILGAYDPAIDDLVADGALGSITGHGERDLPDSCFLRINLPRRVHTYGLGMSLLSLIRHPLDAAGLVELDTAGRAAG